MVEIITDSSVYLKRKEAETLGVRIVPLSYVIGNTVFKEGYSGENNGFELLLRTGYDRGTHHPQILAFSKYFEQSGEALCITISSRLSGTYRAAVAAGKTNGGVTVFDSLMTAGGLSIIVKEAKKLAIQGKSAAEIAALLPAIRDRITVRFLVSDMKPLRGSGRIGLVRQSAGTLLNIKPVLVLKNGAVVNDGVSRGIKDGVKNLIAGVSDETKQIVVNYIGNHRFAADIYNILKSKYQNAEISINKMGPVLGIHLGLEVVAVSAMN